MPNRIPIIVKLVYTAFMAVLVPCYWKFYGLTNFLYFCDVALFFTLIAVWTEKPLFAAMPAVGILLPQALWCVDFFCSMFGLKFVGMTAYMFNPENPLFNRSLSFFHFWLPFFLVYLVWRLGYDRRAFVAWTIVAWILLTVCYVFMPVPPAPDEHKSWMPVNINYVHGLSDDKPQEWMPQWAWLICLYVGLPLVVYWPTHLLLKRLFGRGVRDISADRA